MNPQIEAAVRAANEKYVARQSRFDEIVSSAGERPSIVHAINSRLPQPELRGDNPLQRMLVDELQSEILAEFPELSTKGLVFPLRFLSSRDLDTTSGAGAIYPTTRTAAQELGEISVAASLGATVLPGIVGSNLPIPRVDTQSEAEVVAESSAPAGPSEPTFAAADMVPFTVSAYVDVSRRLLKSITPATDAIIGELILRAIGRQVDRLAFAGTGVDEPTGLIHTSGVNLTAAGTNGAAPTWAFLCGMEEAADAANDGAPTAWVTNAAVRRKLRTTQRASGLDFIWPGQELIGRPARTSPQMPSNLTKGTSSGVCSAIAYGSFSHLLIGFWGPLAVELTFDPYKFSSSGTVRIVARAEIGIALDQPQAFSVCRDLLTS